MKPYPKYSPSLWIVRDSGAKDPLNDPEVHYQTIQALYQHQDDGSVKELPDLWLYGEWLRKAGFEISDEVKIVAYKNRIVIDLESKGNHYDD